MQKIKDKIKKIESQAIANFSQSFSVKLIFIIVFHNVLNLLSLTFYLLSFLKFIN